MTREKLANENPLGLLRMLKGCPLAALFALGLAHQPVGRAWIAQVTGYSQNTTQQALEYLVEIGLAARSGRYEGWSLAAGAEQLPLMFPMPEGDEKGERQNLTLPDGAAPEAGEESERQNLTLASDTAPEAGAGASEGEEHERQNLTLAGGTKPEMGASEGGERQNLTLAGRITTTTTYLNHHESPLTAAVVQERTPNFDARAFAENLEALHAAGVRGKVAEQLARLAYVTPAYVRAHAVKVARDGDTVGLLVTRIRDGDPAPVHAKNCLCVDCDRERRRRYVTGEYAEFIEH